jgi:hypothetical protein
MVIGTKPQCVWVIRRDHNAATDKNGEIPWCILVADGHRSYISGPIYGSAETALTTAARESLARQKRISSFAVDGEGLILVLDHLD